MKGIYVNDNNRQLRPRFFMLPKSDSLRKIPYGEQILYAYMYDKIHLSIANDRKDEDGRYYITCSLTELEKFMNCSRPTAVKMLNGLVEKGLIEKVKNQGRATRYYVLYPQMDEEEFFTSEKDLPVDSAEGSKEVLPVEEETSKNTLPVKNETSKESLPAKDTASKKGLPVKDLTSKENLLVNAGASKDVLPVKTLTNKKSLPADTPEAGTDKKVLPPPVKSFYHTSKKVLPPYIDNKLNIAIYETEGNENKELETVGYDVDFKDFNSLKAFERNSSVVGLELMRTRDLNNIHSVNNLIGPQTGGEDNKGENAERFENAFIGEQTDSFKDLCKLEPETQFTVADKADIAEMKSDDLVWEAVKEWNSHICTEKIDVMPEPDSGRYKSIAWSVDMIGKERFFRVLNAIDKNGHFLHAWQPSIEWFVREKNFVDVEDGKYAKWLPAVSGFNSA